MIPYAKIVGGAPSTVSGMTEHLMNKTLTGEFAQMAAYYGRGLAQGGDYAALAGEIRRFEENLAHVTAWERGEVAPDLVRLAEYSTMSYAHLTPYDIEAAIALQYETAIMTRTHGQVDPAARALHGLPEPLQTPHLDGLDVKELRHRLAALPTLWGEAVAHAEFQADVRDSPDTFDNAPLGIVRPDMHPLVSLGLGLDVLRRPTPEQLNALISGHRADGAPIEGKTYAVERAMPVDPKTRERRFSQPIGSYDFTPAPHKTISVGWAFAPAVEQAMIYNAHIESAREAMALIAGEIGRIRLGKGGEGGSEPGHIGWTEFTHHTSRRVQVTVEQDGIKITQDAGMSADPDLHTHFLIPNAVFGESGKVGSLDTAALAGFIFVADQFYHARFAHKLRAAGFDSDLDPRTGAARLNSVPEEVAHDFSKRTNAGEALARAYTSNAGEDWDQLTPEQRASRIKTATQGLDQKLKGGKDDVADIPGWKKQAKDRFGWEPKTLQLYGPPPPPLTDEQRARDAYLQALPYVADKLEHKSVIPHYDLQVAALRGLVNTGIPNGMDDVKAVTTIMRKEGVRQYGEQTTLVMAQEPGKRHMSITTELHEAEEREFMQLAREASRDFSAALPSDLLEAKIKSTANEHGLRFDTPHGQKQLELIRRAASGPKFQVIKGAAGSGKTTLAIPLVATWDALKMPVYGASLAWRQAEDLAKTGIRPRNLAAFSVLIDRMREPIEGYVPKPGDRPQLKLTPDSRVLVDEFWLLGTRQGLELLRMRKRDGFQIIALGDDKQAASVEAGAIGELTRRAIGPENMPEIATTVRQEEKREQTIVGKFRNGDAADALDMKRADGSAQLAYGGRDGTIAHTAALYAKILEETGKAPSIAAPTNSDAHEISAAVRLHRRELGQVGPDLRTLKATDGEREYELPLAKGDRVRLFKSTRADQGGGRRGPIWRNGSVLDVVDVLNEGLVLRGRSGQIGLIPWERMREPTKPGRTLLAYGDAQTIHTAQGSTTDDHIFPMPGGSSTVDARLAYSSGTRHRKRTWLVVNEQAERMAVRATRPLNDNHDITRDDIWANVAKRFAYAGDRDSATALFERAVKVSRGALVRFQAAKQPSGATGDSPGATLIMEKAFSLVTESLSSVMEAVNQATRQLRPGGRQSHTQARP